MIPTLEQLRIWLAARENEHLEFKEARSGFHFEKLAKYCAALANEGGGSIVLGVTDRRPRRVVGSAAFDNLERTKAGLVERLRLKVEAAELSHPDGRVVVFSIPTRPVGVPVSVEGAYWMRAGEDLVPMTPDMLRAIFDENRPDFTAEICSGAKLSDLDPLAVEDFRRRWHAKSQRAAILTRPAEYLLRDAELVVEGGITFAALILYRLVMYPISTFSERSAREALLNAVAHRDYRHPGSIFVRQYPRRLEVVSPGGFPSGITVQNMLYRQNPRNRRLADSFARCGLVERAGQGADRIYEECVSQGKLLPDFTHTDPYQVSLTLHGEVADDGFLQFLHRLRDENIDATTTQDLLVFDCVRRGRRVPKRLRPWLRRLIGLGVLESSGRGAGTRYLFAECLLSSSDAARVPVGRPADRNVHKEILLHHVRDKAAAGARFDELQQLLPDVGRIQIQRLMRELRQEGLVENRGETKASRWFAAANVAIPE